MALPFEDMRRRTPPRGVALLNSADQRVRESSEPPRRALAPPLPAVLSPPSLFPKWRRPSWSGSSPSCWSPTAALSAGPPPASARPSRTRRPPPASASSSAPPPARRCGSWPPFCCGGGCWGDGGAWTPPCARGSRCCCPRPWSRRRSSHVGAERGAGDGPPSPGPHGPALAALCRGALAPGVPPGPVAYSLRALGGLAATLGDTHTELLRSLLPEILTALKSLLDADEERGAEALEVLDECLEADPAAVTPHLRPLLDLCLQVAGDESRGTPCG
ncbi:uncharacterized protein LOC142074581 [Calonectris borealis]|uniref:uncharacterized protein LOC142074581 n=1 Tax=Calonectris borealis TaxID=1323832 RepID=UPI003F4C24DC